MSLIGIVDWLRKKIIGESKRKPMEAPPIGHVTEKHRAEIETAKKEKERRAAEVWERALAEVAEKEKETGVSARGLGENIKVLSRSREQLERLAWRRAANNDRKLRHRPMVRTRAYIKAERNLRKMMCKRMGGSLWR